jgi:predicted dehydrogenase
MSKKVGRRDFLKIGMATGLGAALSGKSFSKKRIPELISPPPRPVAAQPLDKVKIGFVGIGHMGTGHVRNLLKIPGAQIAAVCDLLPERVEKAKKLVVDAGFPEPAGYSGSENIFRQMCEKEELDLVYNAAPWEWHAPICLAAMENGKHAASEVNIAMTVEDCWKLVETSERTKKYAILMENCCYDYMEMTLLNMIRKGVFGDILHGECGYLHDLRELKLSETYYVNMWRLKHSVDKNGCLYPTHGIGPMAWCMDINRGDAIDYLVSFSSPSIGLNEYAAVKYGPDSKFATQKYALGDINTTVLKTKKGKTIILMHDTNLPRPYTRYFKVQGTKGLARKYPEAKIYIEGRSTRPHRWEDMTDYNEQYEHPVWRKTKEMAQGAGHGGMDFIEDYRLIQALREGVGPDIDVYDSVVWSAIIPLSIESVAKGSAPVKMPDFTRGGWKKPRPLQVDLVE